ncbi:hydrogenase formation protein HypD, partial [candidate division KSB1 bacterium]|nr:hydrogenase formation protein HypD [candidate division KSB1 bacterium]
AFDATQLSASKKPQGKQETVCISGLVLRGLKKPDECPAFAKTCTPLSPLGAPMVSAEGACAAYYAYHRNKGAGGT